MSSSKNSRKGLNKVSKQIIKHYLGDVPINSISKFLDVSSDYVCNVIEVFNELSGVDLDNLCKELGISENNQHLISSRENGKKTDSEAESSEVEKSASTKRIKKSLPGKTLALKKVKYDPTASTQHTSFIRELSLLTNLYRYMAKSLKTRPFLLMRQLSYNRKPRTTTSRPKTISQIVESLSKAVKKADTDHPSENDWPEEIEIIFESLCDSPKESEWSTVTAYCDVICRFGFCWRQKGYSNDYIVKLNSNPIKIKCNPDENESTDDQSICKLDIRSLLQEARSAGNGRIKSCHLEFHLEAGEKKKRSDSKHEKTTTTVNGEKSSFKVHYATAPLPIFVEQNSSSGDVEVSHEPVLLSPGIYELRLGLDTDDYINDCDLEPNNQNPSRTSPLRKSNRLKMKASEVNSVSVNGAGSGRIDWVDSQILTERVGGVMDEYQRWPTIHMTIKWSGDQPLNGAKKSPQPLEENYREKVKSPPKEKRPVGRPSLKKNSSKPSEDVSLLVSYRFLYEGNCQQCAESRDLTCPWCKFSIPLKANNEISNSQAFLFHLRAFHPRLQFKGSWNASKSQLNIDVSFNRNEDCNNDSGLRRWTPIDSAVSSRRDTDGRVIGGWDGLGTVSSQVYDGSGPVRPQKSQTSVLNNINETYGFTPNCLGETANSTVYSLSRAYSRVRKPIKRISYSELIYYKKFDEMIRGEISDPTISIRHVGKGHDRVYYHTWNCQPVRTCEFDHDSENEEEVSYWLKANYLRNIEEFTDVNKGEKSIFELWNEFLLSLPTNFIVMADGQMSRIVLLFIDTCYEDIVKMDLRYNLIAHLVNLVDYGLLSNTLLIIAMMRFDDKSRIIN